MAERARPGALARIAGRLARLRGRRWVRLGGYALGVGLVVAAIWVVAGRSSAGIAGVVEPLAGADATTLVTLAALVAAGPTLTAWSFWLLTKRYGDVGPGEMIALINGAWLLNYLPMWPGLVGRVAYHRRVNGIAVLDSARVLVWANVLSAGASVGVGAAGLALAALWPSGGSMSAWVAASPGVALLALGTALGAARGVGGDGRAVAAMGVRWLEVVAKSWRYAICFALVGEPIGWPAALLLAAAANVATMVPVAPNALGVREWAVGVLGPLLPVSAAVLAAPTLDGALRADLMHRAVELALAVPLGVAGWALVMVRWRAVSRS